MFSRVLLRVASARFGHLLSAYLATVVVLVGLGALALSLTDIAKPSAGAGPAQGREVWLESAANLFGLSSVDVTGRSRASAWIAVSEGLIGVLVNGIFIALVVFRTIRVNHGALVFANHVLLARQGDGRSRLEFRVCNDSRYDMVNVTIRAQFVEYLKSFPRTTAHQTYRIDLNYHEYLVLPAHGYMLISTSSEPARNEGGGRVVQINESLFTRYGSFCIRILIQGQYLKSGLNFSQLHVYEGNCVHRGRWRYYLREDLERKGQLRMEEFSAFEAEPSLDSSVEAS